MANKARIISEEELNELYPKNESKSKNSARIISEQELEDYTRTKSLSELNETATIGDYLRAVPATGVDITAGAAEGLRQLSVRSLGTMI